MDIKTLLIIIASVSLVAAIFWYSNSDEESKVSIPAVTSGEAIKIIAFGDSLTAGYGLTSSQAYPAKLEALLKSRGYSVSVINSGVSGETTKGNLERVPFILSQKPHIVLLGIGGNDALRSLPLTETKSNLTKTITTLKNSETAPVVILLQMQAPLNSGLSYKNEFDAMYEDLAEEHNLVLVPFITTSLFLDSNNKLSDGIHYNETGYQNVVDEYIAPSVIELLETIIKTGT